MLVKINFNILPVVLLATLLACCSDQHSPATCSYGLDHIPNVAELIQNLEVAELRKYVEPDAQSGDPGARQFWGSVLYDTNPEEASYWLRLAAEQQCTTAQMMLATMYDDGHGVEQNSELAFQWFLKAAELGNPSAAQMVSQLYLSGRGVEKNEDLHYYWLEKTFELAPANR